MIVNNAAIELGQKEVINAPATIKQWEDELIEQIDTYLIGEKKPDDGSKEFDIKENEGASATAIHEVGHALMKITEFGETIPFDEITVVPRGRALGYVKGEGNRERKLTKESLLKEIRYILGGRAAEEVIYGHDNISAGASEDIASATGIARNMVSKYGMSEEIGPFALIASTGNYLGKCDEYICTAEVRAKAEETQMKIVREQYLLTVNKLKERKDVLIALSHKVFDMKTMSGEDFMGEYERLVNRGDSKGDQ
jgi:cell division protease FtsH